MGNAIEYENHFQSNRDYFKSHSFTYDGIIEQSLTFPINTDAKHEHENGYGCGDDDGNDDNASPSKDNDGDNGSQRRQTAVLVESDGFVTKNGHRVVIQHSRSPSTTSRLADV